MAEDYEINVATEETHGEKGGWDVAIERIGASDEYGATPDKQFRTLGAFITKVEKEAKRGSLKNIQLYIDRKCSVAGTSKSLVSYLRKFVKVYLQMQ